MTEPGISYAENASDPIVTSRMADVVDLYVAGRPVQHSVVVIRKLLLDHGGPELDNTFCQAMDETLLTWRAMGCDSDALQPLTQCDDDKMAAGRARLASISLSLDALLESLRRHSSNEFQFAALSIEAVQRLPTSECVLFDGRVLRLVHWGRARVSNDGPGKLDINDVLHAIAPTPTLETFVVEQRREKAERPASQRLLNSVRSLFIGRRARELRERAGATQGAITVTLMWTTPDDLDLSVICPNGDRIYFSNMNVGAGRLDVDANCGSVTSETPLENIFFDCLPARGRYRICVHNYQSRQDGNPGSRFEVSLSTPNGTGYATGLSVQGSGPRDVAYFEVFGDGDVKSDLDLHLEKQDVQETH